MTTEPTTPEPNPIVAERYASRRLFKPVWRIRFIGANGEKLGDDYQNAADAEHTIRLLIKPGTPVEYRTRHRDGTITNHGRIR